MSLKACKGVGMPDQIKRVGHSISASEMWVIMEGDGGVLRVSSLPIAFDSQIVQRLYELSESMLSWEKSAAESLAGELRSEFPANNREEKPTVADYAERYFDEVGFICRLTGIAKPLPECDAKENHGWWNYDESFSRLARQSELIRSFNVPLEAFEVCKANLAKGDYLNLLSSYGYVMGVGSIFSQALELYEEKLSEYIDQANHIYPGIFGYTKYCRNLTERFGGAQLDYALTPGNQCIVECIKEYYWACILEEAYYECDQREDIVAFSHRRLGWTPFGQRDISIDIDKSAGLSLILNTNFGFGESSYFVSTLRYRGVNSVSAPYLIFYSGVSMVDFTGWTFEHEVAKNSFASCFSKAVELQTELRLFGEAAFVKKHFEKPLKDLSDLLLLVANTNSFLKVTTLKHLEALTSGMKNELIPDAGFGSMSFELLPGELSATEAFCDAVKNAVSIGGFGACADDMEIRGLIERLLGRYWGLQLTVKRDLVRGHLIRSLAGAFKGQEGKVLELANKLLPPDAGMHTVTYSGYDLVKMRVDKAAKVIDLLAHLRQIATLAGSMEYVEALSSTCSLIAGQAIHFIDEEILPELHRLGRERDGIRAQLGELETKKKALNCSGNQGLDWIGNEIVRRQAELRSLNSKTTLLSVRKSELGRYIRNAKTVLGGASS